MLSFINNLLHFWNQSLTSLMIQLLNHVNQQICTFMHTYICTVCVIYHQTYYPAPILKPLSLTSLKIQLLNHVNQQNCTFMHTYICTVCVIYHQTYYPASLGNVILLWMQHLLYLYSVSIIFQWNISSFCAMFFIFSLVDRSLPHISVIISLTSCDWLLLNYIYKQLCLC